MTKTKHHVQFLEDDFIVIQNIDTTIVTNKKLIPKYKGPYCVKNVRYVINDLENCYISQD